MKMTGNTILITGGGSGIGEGLAVAMHNKGNKVIIAGRRRPALEAAASNHPGIEVELLDVDDSEAVQEFGNAIITRYPGLNVLINNAGIMLEENVLVEPVDLSKAEATIATNLLGPIRLTAALLPHLRKQPQAAVMMVSSGLAFVPLAMTPTYCATKAAIHSYAQSLRHQLRNTSVEVLELAPPAVATDLMPGHRDNPHCMPLHEFVRESVELMEGATDEILVDRVQVLRTAECGQYDEVFEMLNPQLKLASQ